MSVEDEFETQPAVDRVASLRREVDALSKLVNNQQQTIDKQQERIAALQRTVDIKHERRIAQLREHLYGDAEYGIETEANQTRIEKTSVVDLLLAIDDDALRQDDLRSEQITRTRALATQRRLIETLADELDIDLQHLDVEGEDSITRLLRYGPDDVTDRPSPVHHRARCLLSYIGDYGTHRDDANGKRWYLTTSDARQCLTDKREERLTSTRLKRVFVKIRELAADSTRSVSIGTTQRGERRLVIDLESDSR